MDADEKDPKWQLTKADRILIFFAFFFCGLTLLWILSRTDETKHFFPVCGPPCTKTTCGGFGTLVFISPLNSSFDRSLYSFSRHRRGILFLFGIVCMTTFPPFVLKPYRSNEFGNTLNKHRKLAILVRHNLSKLWIGNLYVLNKAILRWFAVKLPYWR